MCIGNGLIIAARVSYTTDVSTAVYQNEHSLIIHTDNNHHCKYLEYIGNPFIASCISITVCMAGHLFTSVHFSSVTSGGTKEQLQHCVSLCSIAVKPIFYSYDT